MTELPLEILTRITLYIESVQDIQNILIVFPELRLIPCIRSRLYTVWLYENSRAWLCSCVRCWIMKRREILGTNGKITIRNARAYSTLRTPTT